MGAANRWPTLPHVQQEQKFFGYRRDDDGTKGLYTRGMPQFGLMDIEVERFDGDPEDVFGIVCGMAH